MKNVLIIVFFLITNYSFAQEKYLDRSGTILFEASEGTFEPVKAKNNSVTVILNSNTGEIASLVLMKEFQFRNALMQEHFNENYIESDVYPKATFKGKISTFNLSGLTAEKKEFTVTGLLKIHGVEKQIEIKLLISMDGSYIFLKGYFIATPQDFNIQIPKIVRNKIAKEVKVQLEFKLKKQ